MGHQGIIEGAKPPQRPQMGWGYCLAGYGYFNLRQIVHITEIQRFEDDDGTIVLRYIITTVAQKFQIECFTTTKDYLEDANLFVLKYNNLITSFLTLIP